MKHNKITLSSLLILSLSLASNLAHADVLDKGVILLEYPSPALSQSASVHWRYEATAMSMGTTWVYC